MNSVILVHGIYDSASRMRPIHEFLSNERWDVHSISLKPNNGTVGIDKLAEQLEQFIKDKTSSGQKIDLVGFSMGGLICRYYMQRMEGLPRVEHFISVSTPQYGTIIGYLSGNIGPKQMRRGSEFIRDLNKDIDNLRSLKLTSIWTPLDLMVVPANSSHLEFGNEKKIWCLVHPWMVSNKKCLQTIKEELLK